MKRRHPLSILVSTAAVFSLLQMGLPVQGAFTFLGWHAETIGPGPYNSLAVDRSGRPGVAYYDVHARNLKYAFRDANGWHVVETGAGYYSGIDPSLALDSEGRPHISHISGYGALLSYSYLDDSGWHTEPISDGVINARSPLAIGDDDRVHVAYLVQDQYGGTNDSFGDQIVYAVREGGAWHTQTVLFCPPGLYAGCASPDMAIDPAGRPNIAFTLQDASGPRVMLAVRDGAAWALEEASGPLDLWEVPELGLAIDAAGSPHIAYSGRSPRLIGYAHRDGAGWHNEIVGGGGPSIDLAVSSSGTPHMVYFDADQTSIKYAYRDTAGWHGQVMNRSRMLGFTSIALAGGYPAISYYDGNAQLLHYVFQTPIDIQPGELPNLIDPHAFDKISVIVMSTASIDAREIDPSSATFGPAGARAGHFQLKDADLDGDIDLGLAFHANESGIRCGDTTAVLRALTRDGQPFVGWDEIETTCGR